jgi:hypothetical protein
MKNRKGRHKNVSHRCVLVVGEGKTEMGDHSSLMRKMKRRSRGGAHHGQGLTAAAGNRDRDDDSWLVAARILMSSCAPIVQ